MIIRNIKLLVAQCLFLFFVAMSSASAVGIAVSTDQVIDATKAVGGLNAQELLALACLSSNVLACYTIHIIGAMSKKPCIYLEQKK